MLNYVFELPFLVFKKKKNTDAINFIHLIWKSHVDFKFQNKDSCCLFLKITYLRELFTSLSMTFDE